VFIILGIYSIIISIFNLINLPIPKQHCKSKSPDKMANKSSNSNLTNAKNAKNDEFYTQYHDIEKEINAYIKLTPLPRDCIACFYKSYIQHQSGNPKSSLILLKLFHRIPQTRFFFFRRQQHKHRK